MTPPEFFRNLQRNLPQLERQILHDVIQVEAERFHAENFRNEGFTDVALQKWPARKKPDRNAAKRALLVKSGALRRHATKGTVRGKQVDFDLPLAYARRHNEGLKGMPKRQYVGQSAVLEDRIRRKVVAVLNQRLK